MKVGVLGLGVVGLPTAIYAAEKNLQVVCYDINPVAVERARSEGLEAHLEWEELGKCDVYIVCVSTLYKEGKPDFSALFDISKKLKSEEIEHALISIESTVVPGTCRKIQQELRNRELNVIHVPHRYWGKDPVNHGVRQMRVIGAVDEESLKNGMAFYENTLDIPLHVVPSIEVAEMSKVLENSYRYLHIAFAEECKMICEGLNLDFEKVREACNTKWNTEILEAREGIGGHCLLKDTHYITSMSPYAHMLKKAVYVDNKYREWLEKMRFSSNTLINKNK